MRQLAPRVIVLVALAAGVGYLIAGREYPVFQNDQPGTGLYPLLVGVFWVITATVAAVGVWREPVDAAGSIEWPDRQGWLRIGLVFVCCIAYIQLVGVLGDLVMSLIVMVVVMRAMGVTDLIRLAVTSVGLALVWHFVFVVNLHVALPQGIFGR